MLAARSCDCQSAQRTNPLQPELLQFFWKRLAVSACIWRIHLYHFLALAELGSELKNSGGGGGGGGAGGTEVEVESKEKIFSCHRH